MNVLVLGCGPAGLLAAHAAQLAGHQVDVVSDKRKSVLGGAQYLHHPIPGLTPEEPQGRLYVLAQGSMSGYAQKVYGDPEAPVSWEMFVHGEDKEPIPIWDIVDTYNELWNRWEPVISQDVITEPQDVFSLIKTYGKVISTIPAKALCLVPELHQFQRQKVYIVPRFPFETPNGGNFIVYNGHPNDTWYRGSRIFGRGMSEYSNNTLVPFGLLKEGMWVSKPLDTDCDCWPGQVLKVGRYGKWHKGDLVTDAFDEVFNEFNQ